MHTQIPAEKRRVKLGRLVESEGYPNLEELLQDTRQRVPGHLHGRRVRLYH